MGSTKDKRSKRKEQLRQRRTAEAEVLARLQVEEEFKKIEDPAEGDVAADPVLEDAVDDVGRRLEERILAKEAAEAEGFGGTEEEEGEGAEAEGKGPAEEDDDEAALMARLAKKATKRNRMNFEELRNRVGPRLAKTVGMHDVNAPYPVFTVLLKGVRNTVPVPRHWLQKRAFLSLQTDREDGAYVVPSFVKDTGVDAVRRANDELGSAAFFSGLHDAFVQPIPGAAKKTKLLSAGDVFYETRDNRALRYSFVPGELSTKLQKALGMTEANTGAPVPPPWLVALQKMQRLPPSYPDMKIPGLNAPLPPGAHWGRAVGLWGEPARNSDGSYVFPDVIRPPQKVERKQHHTTLWGFMPPAPAAEVRAAAPAPVRVQPAAAPEALPSSRTVPKAIVPAEFIAAATQGGGGNIPLPPGIVPPPPLAPGMQEFQRRVVSGEGIMAAEYRYEAAQQQPSAPLPKQTKQPPQSSGNYKI